MSGWNVIREINNTYSDWNDEGVGIFTKGNTSPEVFNQIVLCAQKARPIDISNYKKTNVTMVVCMWIFPLKKDMSYTIFMHSYLMFISRIGMITITTEETNITHDGLEWNFKALHFN